MVVKHDTLQHTGSSEFCSTTTTKGFVQMTLCLAEEGHTTIQLASTSYLVIQRQGGNNLMLAKKWYIS